MARAKKRNEKNLDKRDTCAKRRDNKGKEGGRGSSREECMKDEELERGRDGYQEELGRGRRVCYEGKGEREM